MHEVFEMPWTWERWEALHAHATALAMFIDSQMSKDSTGSNSAPQDNKMVGLKMTEMPDPKIYKLDHLKEYLNIGDLPAHLKSLTSTMTLLLSIDS